MSDDPNQVFSPAHMVGLSEFAFRYTCSSLRARTKEQAVKLIRKIEVIAERDHAEIQRLAANAGDEFKLACSAGCDYCCHQLVSISAAEAIRVATYLREKWTEEEIQELLRRCRDAKQKLYDTPNGERPFSACVLLKDHLCSIHEARPIICRAYNSLDKSRCIEQYNNRDKILPTRGLDPMWVSGMALTDGMRQGLTTVGLEGSLYVLPLILEILLSQPDAADRYLAGEDVLNAALCHNPDPVLDKILNRIDGLEVSSSQYDK